MQEYAGLSWQHSSDWFPVAYGELFNLEIQTEALPVSGGQSTNGRSSRFARMLANVWPNGPGSVRDVRFLGTTTKEPVGTLGLFMRGADSRNL